jgi:hypothetical protein
VKNRRLSTGRILRNRDSSRNRLENVQSNFSAAPNSRMALFQFAAYD